jgi:hypothetical protein
MVKHQEKLGLVNWAHTRKMRLKLKKKEGQKLRTLNKKTTIRTYEASELGELPNFQKQSSPQKIKPNEETPKSPDYSRICFNLGNSVKNPSQRPEPLHLKIDFMQISKKGVNTAAVYNDQFANEIDRSPMRSPIRSPVKPTRKYKRGAETPKGNIFVSDLKLETKNVSRGESPKAWNINLFKPGVCRPGSKLDLLKASKLSSKLEIFDQDLKRTSRQGSRYDLSN